MTTLGIDLGGTRTKLGLLEAGAVAPDNVHVLDTAHIASVADLAAAIETARGTNAVSAIGLAVPGRVTGDVIRDVWDDLAYLGEPGFVGALRRPWACRSSL